ncbi:hypothetical protein IQ265_08585 [Nodosilinea sp. LEGE 06152]|uniref:hypothetical protein n=1 Tax=Nodosilinea sp. LEGE 06152 TaxID=2777966 RepID=UPI001880FCB7|nr:hypothetical protein [Nodosilinea sp. LEGE 06152]MBE9156885.1 hypothetical protein [Nodosilinea sp. LEGE 06152]
MLWRATLAIGAGILLGGSAARVEDQACAQPGAMPRYCLMETSRARVADGMVGGAFASGSALLMIELWGRFRKPD